MEAVRPEWSEEEPPLPGIEQPKAESAEPMTEEKAQALAFAEGRLAAKALERQPVIASDRVSKAAEVDRPIEKELEERHERKGSIEDTPRVESVRSIIEKFPSRQPQKSLPAQKQRHTTSVPQASEDQKPVPAQPGISLYGQAIQAGFVMALMLIIAFILLRVLN